MRIGMRMIQARWIRWLLCFGMFVVVCACGPEAGEPLPSKEGIKATVPDVPRKKVLYVNSYDLDMSWARSSLNGALDILNGSFVIDGNV